MTPRRVLGLVLAAAVLATAYFAGNSELLAAPLLRPDTQGHADAIVVLGSETNATCEPDIASIRRTTVAAQAFRDGRAPLVVLSGGQTGGSSCAVASAMADLAVKSGIPPDHLRLDNLSADSSAQFERCDAILRTLGARRILIVTSALEMAIDDDGFRRLGYDVERTSVPLERAEATYWTLLCARARQWLVRLPSSQQGPATVSAVPETAGPDWRVNRENTHADGPIVLLGTSYAHSWQLAKIADRPIVNRGRAGQLTSEMSKRFDEDVLPVHPRAVVIWGFDNDLFDPPKGGMSAAVAGVERAIDAMVGGAVSHGIEPILATEVTMRHPPGAYEAFATFAESATGRLSYEDRVNKQVLDLNSWLRELALRRNLLLLDVQPVLSDRRQLRLAPFAKPDGVHITEAGYAALTAYAAPILAHHFSADATTAP